MPQGPQQVPGSPALSAVTSAEEDHPTMEDAPPAQPFSVRDPPPPQVRVPERHGPHRCENHMECFFQAVTLTVEDMVETSVLRHYPPENGAEAMDVDSDSDSDADEGQGQGGPEAMDVDEPADEGEEKDDAKSEKDGESPVQVKVEDIEIDNEQAQIAAEADELFCVGGPYVARIINKEDSELFDFLKGAIKYTGATRNAVVVATVYVARINAGICPGLMLDYDNLRGVLVGALALAVFYVDRKELSGRGSDCVNHLMAEMKFLNNSDEYVSIGTYRIYDQVLNSVSGADA